MRCLGIAGNNMVKVKHFFRVLHSEMGVTKDALHRMVCLFWCACAGLSLCILTSPPLSPLVADCFSRDRPLLVHPATGMPATSHTSASQLGHWAQKQFLRRKVPSPDVHAKHGPELPLQLVVLLAVQADRRQAPWAAEDGVGLASTTLPAHPCLVPLIQCWIIELCLWSLWCRSTTLFFLQLFLPIFHALSLIILDIPVPVCIQVVPA